MPPLTGDPSNYPTSDLENGITGQCLCTNITLTLSQKSLFTKPNGFTCHCSNCRKFTGSSNANILRLPASNCQMDDPQRYYRTFADTNTRSGDVFSRGFCSNCGTSIGNIPATSGGRGDGEWAIVWLGMFPRMPAPEFELFSAHRREWVKPVEGAVQWDSVRSKETKDVSNASIRELQGGS